MMSKRTMETPQRNSRDAVANTREPCNVARTLTRVAGGQSIVDKAHFCQGIVACAPGSIISSYITYACRLPLTPYLEQTCGSGQEHLMKSSEHWQKHLGARSAYHAVPPETNPPKERLYSHGNRR